MRKATFCLGDMSTKSKEDLKWTIAGFILFIIFFFFTLPLGSCS